jgi:hypothetical protein
MAQEHRRIFVMKNPRVWMGIRYVINAFPMRALQPKMVTTMAMRGLLNMDKHGYRLTSLGMWIASKEKAKEKKRCKPQL